MYFRRIVAFMRSNPILEAFGNARKHRVAHILLKLWVEFSMSGWKTRCHGFTQIIVSEDRPEKKEAREEECEARCTPHKKPAHSISQYFSSTVVLLQGRPQ